MLQRLASGLIPIALLMTSAVTSAATGGYTEADLTGILRNAERAADLQAPLVLLAHQTAIDFLGNGRRLRDEHWVWYVGDPDHPATRQLQSPRYVLETRVEAFGLRRCRIFRGRDTLRVERGLWELHPPPGWPATRGLAWSAAGTDLPRLEAGDVVEIAYEIQNRWAPRRLPSNWEWIPIHNPWAPSLERHILVTHNSVLQGNLRVLNDPARLQRHYGPTRPKIECLTGNLPPGPAEPSALSGPRLLFTTSPDWESVRKTLYPHYHVVLLDHQNALAAIGDSLAQAQATSRKRAAAVLAYLAHHWERIPRPLTASGYYPRPAELVRQEGNADPLDWALLAAGLAGATRLKVELFLGRSDSTAFLPDLPTPMQFDRLLLAVFVAEEARYLLLDPQAPTLDQAIAGAQDATLLFGLLEELTGFHERTPDGRPIPCPAEP